MKNKTSQLSFIKDCLLSKGEISRNECLKHYISRLGARINDLRHLGWNFITETRKTLRPNGEVGKDFVYKLVK